MALFVGSPAKVSLKVASGADALDTWKPTNVSLVAACLSSLPEL